LTTPASPPSLGSPPPALPKKRKKEPENQDKPLGPTKLKKFIGMKKTNRRKFIDKPILDYDRSIKKSYDKRKSRSSSASDVPQLGAQQK
jgi:hypothetical protein